MARLTSVITAPAVTSFASLANSLTAVASCAALTVGTTNNVTDHLVQVTLTGPATMTASASTMVNLYAFESVDGTIWSGSNTTNELIDGTDKAVTLSANGNQGVWLGNVMMTTTTAGTSIIYKSKVISIKSALGKLPNKYVIVAQNQSGAALPATGHSIAVQEEYYT